MLSIIQKLYSAVFSCIQKHTINHGKKNNDDFDLHVDELESFIGLQIARGVLVGKNTPGRATFEQGMGTTNLSKYNEQ